MGCTFLCCLWYNQCKKPPVSITGGFNKWGYATDDQGVYTRFISMIWPFSTRIVVLWGVK